MKKDEIIYLVGTLKTIQKNTGNDIFITKEIEKFIDAGLISKMIKKGYLSTVQIQTSKGILSGLTISPKGEEEYSESGIDLTII